jgi:uncharacterized membrane protein YcaP (DUF421 family)
MQTLCLGWHAACSEFRRRRAAGERLVEALDGFFIQAAKAAAYYIALIVLVRLAGKRLAGQTTTFDLIVLIALGVVMQSAALAEGAANAAIFVLTVFALHRLNAWLCSRSSRIRHLLRGKPRPLIRDGNIIERALELEGVTHAELLAGLRKLGYARVDDVRLAVLEETGHISALGRDSA